MKGEKAGLIFWSLHFPSGLISNKLPRTHPCTHQSHYPSPPTWRHRVNSTVCREMKNQQHNETADDELGVCVCVCVYPRFKCFAWNLLAQIRVWISPDSREHGSMRNALQQILWSKTFNLFRTCLSVAIEAMWKSCVSIQANWVLAFDGNHDPCSLSLDLTGGFLYNVVVLSEERTWVMFSMRQRSKLLECHKIKED